MSNLMNDFNTFFTSILSTLQTFFDWFLSTVIGEIILFMALISIFLYLIYLIVNFKK